MYVCMYREWFSVCEEAMHALFHLHPYPDQVASLVLQQMYEGLSATAAAGDGQAGVCGIARLMFVLGQTSLCTLVYTEFVAATAKKHPVKDTTTEEGATKSVAKATKKASAGANSGRFQENEGAVDAMEEEMGAAAAADADHERVRASLVLALCYTAITVTFSLEFHYAYIFSTNPFHTSNRYPLLLLLGAKPDHRAGAGTAQPAGQVPASIILHGGQRAGALLPHAAARDLHPGDVQVYVHLSDCV